MCFIEKKCQKILLRKWTQNRILFFKKYIANLQALVYTGPFNPNTLEDFWSIVWQDDSSKIVMLTNLYEGDKVNDGEKIKSKEENIIYYIQEEFYSIIKIILILFF